MKTLYLDCSMGAAGDMLAAALLELLPDSDAFLAELNAMGIPGVRFSRQDSVKNGITGTRFSVTVDGVEEGGEHDRRHHHSGLDDIHKLIGTLALPENVRKDVMAVYGLLARAESRVHGRPVEQIHFHEVGALDAVADISAVCLLIDRLAPDRIAASPVRTGSGQVRCAHGILPVPAPATAELLLDIPTFAGDVPGEMCTPTGAALLRHFAGSFGPMPLMSVQAIGCGMGKKDFETANCLRAMLGRTEGENETVLELSCNVDDMSGEAVGFAMERLFEAGALDVYTLHIGMKKSRPGTLIRAMCREDDRDAVVGAFFKHTSTIGVRESRLSRHVLPRRIETLDTPYGPVRRKVSGEGAVEREKYEYDDLARIARQRGISLFEVEKLIEGI